MSERLNQATESLSTILSIITQIRQFPHYMATSTARNPCRDAVRSMSSNQDAATAFEHEMEDFGNPVDKLVDPNVFSELRPGSLYITAILLIIDLGQILNFPLPTAQEQAEMDRFFDFHNAST